MTSGDEAVPRACYRPLGSSCEAAGRALPEPPCVRPVNLVFRFLVRYCTPYALWYLGGVIALAATTWLSTSIPLYLRDAIDALGRGEEGLQIVLSTAITVALMGAAVMVVRTLSRVLFFTPGRLVEARVKSDLFDRILEHQPGFLRQWPAGDLISRASSDVNSLRLLGGFGLLQACNVVVVIGLTIYRMVSLNAWLTLYLLVPLVVGLILTQVTIRWLFLLIRRMQKEIAAVSDHALSSYEGVATLKAFAAEDAMQRRFDALNGDYQRTTVQRAGLRALIGPILNVAALVAVFVLLYVGGGMVIDGELTQGGLVAYTTLVAFLAGPLRGLGFLLAILKQAQASLERLFEVMDPEPERPDLPNAVEPPQAPPALELRSLSFRYEEDERPALHEVSVRVPAGATLGVLGPTGSGKTTLLRCISRLYNPPPETVFVDGVDVRRLHLESWRQRAVLVPQRPFLFSESLQDNILLGRGEREQLDRALELAALEQDVQALPDGVDSQVGESGLMLSGGQRQRSALARGLIRDPDLLMLDDVLSAVDHATEAVLIDTLRGGDAGSSPTTIIVANRISAIQHAEVILVLDKGRVVGLGTHAELVTQDGLYRETWEKQSEGEAAK